MVVEKVLQMYKFINNLLKKIPYIFNAGVIRNSKKTFIFALEFF